MVLVMRDFPLLLQVNSDAPKSRHSTNFSPLFENLIFPIALKITSTFKILSTYYNCSFIL